MTYRYNPPPRPPQWKDDSSDEDTNICDDDEECGDFGSGVYFEGSYIIKKLFFKNYKIKIIIRYICKQEQLITKDILL